jgi:hypothetical protein
MEMGKELFTERELAELGVRSRSALRNDRWRGRGIEYIRIGRSVRYPRDAVLAFLEKRRVKTSDL